MIVALLRRLFQPHRPTPAPPDVRLTPLWERDAIEERKQKIRAEMRRLEIEAEQPALKRIYKRG